MGDRTEAWLKGMVANLARPPKGGDTDQIKGRGRRRCDIAVTNTYYLARMMRSNKPEDVAVVSKVGVVFPNQESWGTHLNIAGGAVATHSEEPGNAIKFLEYLASPGAQNYFANGNNRWPAAKGVALDNPALKAMTGGKPFKSETIPISAVGQTPTKVQQMLDRVGFASNPPCPHPPPSPAWSGLFRVQHGGRCAIIDVYVNVTHWNNHGHQGRYSSSPAAHRAWAKARHACWPPGRHRGHCRHAGRKGEAVAREIGGAFVKCDVSNEADGQAVVAKAVSLGKLVGLVNCAGIAPPRKTVGKNGAHALALFSKTITVNLIGSFNMIRLAAEAMSRTSPNPPASVAC